MFIDIILGLLLIIACFKGFQKGFVVAIFSFAALILGLAAAMKLSAWVALLIQNKFNYTAKWIPFISFLLVLLAVILLVRLGAKLIEKTLQMAMMGWLNRLGGILLYTLLYTIILSIILFYADKIHIVNTSTFNASSTWKYIQPFGPKAIDIIGKVIPIFKNMFGELEHFFGTVPQSV